jgi:hypothetical protein
LLLSPFPFENLFVRLHFWTPNTGPTVHITILMPSLCMGAVRCFPHANSHASRYKRTLRWNTVSKTGRIRIRPFKMDCIRIRQKKTMAVTK